MTSSFSIKVQIRWADIDANRHLRHSAYYDYGATIRMKFLLEGGLTSEKFEELKVGPVLFREEAIFKREVKLEDHITVDAVLTKATADFSRWSLRHNFIKEDGSLAAIVSVDAAWMDIVKRKLTVPNALIQEIFSRWEKAPDFQLIVPGKKV
jgi:acyl-CoA thioester hydrolase